MSIRVKMPPNVCNVHGHRVMRSILSLYNIHTYLLLKLKFKLWQIMEIVVGSGWNGIVYVSGFIFL